MSLFAVTREAGPGWKDGGIFEQPAVSEHAAFLNGLAGEGFLLFGGPLCTNRLGLEQQPGQRERGSNHRPSPF